MLSTPHLLVGAAIGSTVTGVPAAFVFGFLSHFLLDAIPHEDEYLLDQPGQKKILPVDYGMVTFDIAVGVIAVLYFAFWGGDHIPLPVLAGALGAVVPDLLHNVPFWNPTVRKLPVSAQLYSLHQAVDGGLKGKHKLMGVVTQFITIIVATIILAR